MTGGEEKKMGLFEMLLGEEEAKKLRSAYKGRDAEIPAHMTSGDYSMAFEGHPFHKCLVLGDY